MTELPSPGLIWLIRIYQYLLSPLLGPSRRFTPNCSVYAVEALRQHGPCTLGCGVVPGSKT